MKGRHIRGSSLRMRVVGAVLVVASLAGPGARAQEKARPLDAQARAAVLDAASRALERAYVFPEVAARMGADLQERAERGEYEAVTDPQAFAALLTEHLQGVSHDKHLRVRVGNPQPPPRPAGAVGATLFGRVERLDGDVAYVEINTFANTVGRVRDDVARVMGSVADARALILDVRRNGGGRPELVALVASYLFGREPVLLNTIYDRIQNSTREFRTDPSVEGARFGPEKPVWVLTSGRTFSGAEEFAYDLQTQGRAVLVGETTGGGANPGGFVALPHGLGVFVPSGRAINPITGTNWEGVGVRPDVPVAADDALDTALRLARSQTAGTRIPGA